MDSMHLQHAGADILLQAVEVFIADNAIPGNAKPMDGFSNSGLSSRVAKFVENKNTQAMERIRREVFSFADAYGVAINDVAFRPDEFEVELLFSVSAKGDICIVSADNSATLRVKMKWNKPL